MIIITKANGDRQPFNPNKLKRSLRRSGASKKVAESVTEQIHKNIKNNESTSEIYKKAFKLLRQNGENVLVARYSLKNAIRDLGPTGYPFEYFVAKLFEARGYDTQVGRVVNGLCISHEVDVLANKGSEEVLVEVKFRNRPGDSIGVGVPLYMKSRFEDILAKRKKNEINNFRCMIFTNTRFSRNAIRYARCSGVIELVGWRYPANKGLEKIIEQSGLHPITVLSGLSRGDKEMLLKKGIVVCRDINESPDKLSEIGLSKNKIRRIIDESRRLCSLN